MRLVDQLAGDGIDVAGCGRWSSCITKLRPCRDTWVEASGLPIASTFRAACFVSGGLARSAIRMSSPASVRGFPWLSRAYRGTFGRCATAAAHADDALVIHPDVG